MHVQASTPRLNAVDFSVPSTVKFVPGGGSHIRGGDAHRLLWDINYGFWYPLRLVFTGDGIGVGVIIGVVSASD